MVLQRRSSQHEGGSSHCAHHLASHSLDSRSRLSLTRLSLSLSLTLTREHHVHLASVSARSSREGTVMSSASRAPPAGAGADDLPVTQKQHDLERDMRVGGETSTSRRHCLQHGSTRSWRGNNFCWWGVRRVLRSCKQQTNHSTANLCRAPEALRRNMGCNR